MSARMQAGVITAPGQVEVQNVPLPQPHADQVRVKLEGCGVCASNIPPWEGREWFQYPFAPGQLGHEGWGRVDAVGENVSGLRVGDRVAMLSNNAYAQYDVANESAIVRLTPQLDDLPFPGEPLGCAVNIWKRSAVQSGETVAIVGIGFLGALLTQMITKAGGHVVAIARRPLAQETARRMGAAHVIAMDDHYRIIEEVKSLTDGRFADVVIECVGKQWPLDLSAELTKERGRLVVAGYHQDGPRQVNMQLWNWRGLDVINAHEREESVYTDGIAQAAQMVADGALDPASLYTHTFALSQLGEALNATKERPDGFMKALIRF